MPRRIHYLNVKNGACSILQHTSGNVSMFDIRCGVAPVYNKAVKMSATAYESKGWDPVPGNYQQKYEHDNPIEYLSKLGVTDIFRFIVTHPDMDHLDGISDLFSTFRVHNFWDTDNTKEFAPGTFDARPRDGVNWNFYKQLRDSSPSDNPRRLVLHSGDRRPLFKDEGLQILAPTLELVARGNRIRDSNDASYVVLYTTKDPVRKILFTGDSEDETWKHILANHRAAVTNVDVLIAPHHGRDSGRSYEFLKVVNPHLTLFGNALTDHHAHKPWHNRGHTILTNNQAGYVVLDVESDCIQVYAKNEVYARNLTKRNGWDTFYSEECDGWYLGPI